MTDDRSRPTGARYVLATVTSASFRIVADLLVVGLWVLFLTLLFLATAWPRWAFYALLVIGVACYVQVTASWWWSTEPETEADSPADD